jgi:hypothetical protein
VYYQADSVNGIVWQLRYNAASASLYKWEMLGGSPLNAAASTGVGLTAGTWTQLAAPTITIPRQGEYLHTYISCGNVTTPASPPTWYTGFGIGGTLNNGSAIGITIPQTTGQVNTGASDVFFVHSAGDVLTMFVYCSTAGGIAATRFLAVRPIRVI